MAKESRATYITGDNNLDRILALISSRLDIIEGLRPDLSSGIYALENGKIITTNSLASFYKWDGTDAELSDLAVARTSLGLGTMAVQNANAVDITGGNVIDVLIDIQDANETIIHEFPIWFLAQTCEWFMFL